MIDTERLDLPSASKFDITFFCPGSKNLIDGLPKEALVIELPDELAERGNRIHRAWQTGDTSNLVEDELEDYNSTLEISKKIEQEWLSPLMASGGSVTEHREHRLWLIDDHLKPRASGQFDKLLICGTHALVLDLKSGWLKNLTPAEQNWQLRLLAILVWLEYGCMTVRVAFVKPKRPWDSQDAAEYDLVDLKRSHFMAEQALWESDQPTAQRRPGAHCRWCPAKGWCVENAAMAMIPRAIAPNTLEAVQYLNISELSFLHSNAPVIGKVLEAVKKRLKSFPEEELKAQGWRIGDGMTLDPVRDSVGAYRAIISGLAEKGFFWKVADPLQTAMELKKGKAIDAVKTLTGWTKKESETFVKTTIEPYVEKKQSEGSLERIK